MKIDLRKKPECKCKETIENLRRENAILEQKLQDLQAELDNRIE